MNEYPITFYEANGKTVAANGVLVTDVSLQSQTMTLVPATNGEQYSAFPAGNPPAPTWAAMSNYLNQTTSLSINIITSFVTPTSGTTLSAPIVNGVAGASLPTGWTFTGGNTFVYNGTSVNGSSFTVSWIASNNGVNTQGPTITCQGAGTPSGDTTAPTVVVGTAVSNLAATSATLSGFAPADPSPNGITWSGNKQLNVTLTPSVSAGPVSLSAGLQATLTFADIGAPSPASSISQSGADLTLSTYGNGLYGTTDQCASALTQLSGSFVATCKLNASSDFPIVSGNDFAYAGLEARATMAANSARVDCLSCNLPYSSTAGSGVLQQVRASAGAATSFTPVVNPGAAPIWLVLQYNAATTTATTYYSLDGNTLIQIGSPVVINLGTSFFVGGVAASNVASQQVTAVLRQMSIQTSANWSLNLTGLAAATTYTASIVSEDIATNTSAAASVVFTTPGGGAVKPHQGHYAMSGGIGGSVIVTPSNQAQMIGSAAPDWRGVINPATGKPGFKGFASWYSLFYLLPDGGPYDGQTGGGALPSGWSGGTPVANTSLIDADLASLAAFSAADGVTYTLCIGLMTNETWVPTTMPSSNPGNAYTGGGTNQKLLAPYSWYSAATSPSGVSGGDVIAASNNVQLTSLWRAATMAKVQALLKYLGQKYDSNPNVTIIWPFDETGTPAPASWPSDYSSSNYSTQYIDAMQTLATYAPTTVKIWADNWGVNGEALSAMAPRFATIVTFANTGFGGPDVIYLSNYGVNTPACGSAFSPGTGGNETSGEAVLRGEGGSAYSGSAYANSAYGSVNYTGTVPTVYQVQANAYNWVNQTSVGTEAYAYNDAKYTALIWVDVGTNGNSGNNWASVAAALRAVNFRHN